MPHARFHIVNGDSAAGSLRESFGSDPESILVQHDVLSCGPLPSFESLEQWRQLREQFWQRIWDISLSSHHLHDLLSNAQQLRGAKAIFLWMGWGLSDQLLLPSTVRLFELVGAPAEFSTVQFTRYAG